MDLKIWRPRPRVIVVERQIRIAGQVEFQVNGKTVKRRNTMLAGMGQNFAYASRTGTCKMINSMRMHKVGGSGWVWLSTPVRTAGGQGGNDYVTVQSTWTNTTGAPVTFDQFWMTCEPFSPMPIILDIAMVDNDSVTVPDAATLTINWKIQIPSTTCGFSAAQRNDMAQGISPQVGHGGALYNFTHVKFVWAAGDSGLQVVTGYTGGTGYDQVLATSGEYLHAAAAVIVTEAEIYNSNGDLVEEITTLAEDLDNGETIQVIYTTTYLGV